jgi:hypothetical protein
MYDCFNRFFTGVVMIPFSYYKMNVFIWLVPLFQLNDWRSMKHVNARCLHGKARDSLPVWCCHSLDGWQVLCMRSNRDLMHVFIHLKICWYCYMSARCLRREQCNVDGQSGVFTVPCRGDPTQARPGRTAACSLLHSEWGVASDVTYTRT